MPSASSRFSRREGKTLYIFPTSRKRMARSDIVDDDPLRSREKPATADKRCDRHEQENGQMRGARPNAEHDHLLVGDDEVCKWIEREKRLERGRDHVRRVRD